MLFSDCLIYLFSLFLIQPLSSSLAPFSSFPPYFWLCPLTCPPLSLSTIHLPSPSSISFPLSALACVSLHAWLAAVIPLSPSMIRGQCRNRCITGRNLTTQHNRPNTLSFVITDSSGKKNTRGRGGGGGRDVVWGSWFGQRMGDRQHTSTELFKVHTLICTVSVWST